MTGQPDQLSQSSGPAAHPYPQEGSACHLPGQAHLPRSPPYCRRQLPRGSPAWRSLLRAGWMRPPAAARLPASGRPRTSPGGSLQPPRARSPTPHPPFKRRTVLCGEAHNRHPASQGLRAAAWVWEITMSNRAISVVLLKPWGEAPREDGASCLLRGWLQPWLGPESPPHVQS